MDQPDGSAGSDGARAGGQASVSIFVKLLVLIVSLLLTVTACLASFLISRQVEEQQAQLEGKAATYGLLTSKQVQSAVAFNDVETAREAFDALAEDPEVESLTLFTSAGKVLHARGASSTHLPVDVRQVTRAVPFAVPGRVGNVVPVVSLEGPRGALVVELTTRRLEASRAAIVQRAVVACVLAALVGALGAFLLARPLARRVQAIARVANAVAAGDLSQAPVPIDGTRDELGVTAVAFNAMLRRLQDLIAQIRQNAHQEQERLEGLVNARTSELASRNDDMRRVLDNVGQGFVTVDLDCQMSRERSAILETWFGPPPASNSFADYVASVEPSLARWFAVCWESMLDNLLPFEVALAQLPRRLSKAGQHFELDYRPLRKHDGQLDRLVIVLSDVTAAMARARAEADEREATQLFKRLIADRAGFLEFFAEARSLVDAIRDDAYGLSSRKRALHTLKGNALLYGLESIGQVAHTLEDRLAEHGTLRPEDIEALLGRWRVVAGKIGELVGGDRGTLEITRADYWSIFAAVERQTAHAQLRDMLSSWRLEPTQVRLQRIGEQATALAARLDKGEIAVSVEGNELRLASERWSPFWAAATHVVRNAVDHGLEAPEERLEKGKTATGRLFLRTYVQGDAFAIEFRDDGRGIDWEAIRQRAAELGAPSSTHADLLEALCLDGLSTKDAISELSGRGVGFGAVRRACQDLDGKMQIESVPDRGTTVRFVWPAKVLVTLMPSDSRSTRPSSGMAAGLERTA